MSKYLVETHYTCSFKIVHELEELNEKTLQDIDKRQDGKVEIVDLRTIHPLDEELILNTAKRHGKCLVVTEEPSANTFAQSVAALVSYECFEQLDAPVQVLGSENTPAIPLNSNLEQAMIPNATKVEEKIKEILNY